MATTTLNTIERITLKSIVATAASSGKLSQEMIEKRKHARDFLRTLGKRVRLQDRIESQPTTVYQLEKREDALSELKFVERRLSIACFVYGLPNDYNRLDDALFEIFGKRADRICNILG